MSDASAHYYRAKYGSKRPYDLGQAFSYALRLGDLSCIEWIEQHAPCGCIAFRDGTGEPCAEHHPDAGAGTDARPDPVTHPEYWTE